MDGNVISGYSSELVAAPGDALRFHVSSDVGDFAARVVSLDGADGGWESGGELGTYAGREQRSTTGSCVVVPVAPVPDAKDDVVAHLHVWPTLPADGRCQGILSWPGLGLWVGLRPNGCVEARVGDASVVAWRPVRARQWYRIVVALDRVAGDLSLRVEPLSRWIAPEGATESTAIDAWPGSGGGELYLGATSCDATTSNPETLALAEPFNGKIATPWIATLPLAAVTDRLQAAVAEDGPVVLNGNLLAAWDLARAVARTVTDRGPGAHHGFTVNTPTSAVTGPAWDGRTLDYRTAPAEYDALHFHDDDLDDARWAPDVELMVPDRCESGIYGLEVAAGGESDTIPFSVRPGRGRPGTPIALLLPTFTYVTYANQRLTPGEYLAVERHTLRDDFAPWPEGRILDERPDVVGGIYDRHRDGSSFTYSSHRRPIVDMRHDYNFRFTDGPRHFAADVAFARWLRAHGHLYDVITDADLHAEGRALLDRFNVVITGSHPEYVSETIHRSVEDYASTTGRVMYLGGNGFYYVVGVDPDRPEVIEVRRGPGGGNANGDSPPGEAYLSTTGEPGGHWRQRGRAAQRALGVGSFGMGWGLTGGYARTEVSGEPEVDWMFEGVEGPIGAGEGTFLGAPADEIDRADERLGSPPNGVVVATSEGRHDDRYVLIPDGGGSDRALTAPYADIFYAEAPEGGAIFAVGSMNWTNAVVRGTNAAGVTENVIRRLTDPIPRNGLTKPDVK